MNFPHATPEQWTAAQRIIRGVCSSHGIRGADADDAVQEWTHRAMTKAHRKVCPVSPTAAAVGMRRLVAQYGIGRLLRETRPQSQTFVRPAGRIGLEQPQPDAEPLAIVARAPASANPATMAEAGEALAARCPRYAQQARARGLTPAALALAAAGWGPLDEVDADKTSPSVPACGPGYTPPARGCPGLHTATDPGQRSPAAPPVFLEGESLTAYRAALAVYYAR